MNRTVIAALSLAAICLFSGCRGGVISGTCITPAMVGFVEPAKTTKTEILSNLGPPTVIYHNDRLFAYIWQRGWNASGTTYNGEGWRNLSLSSNRGPHVFETERWTAGLKQNAFCVLFDDTDRVSRVGYLKKVEPEQFEEAVYGWAGWETVSK